MAKKDGVIKIKDKEGIEKEYIILASFRFNEKYFVIYTDYSRDKDRNIKVFASIYNPDDKNNQIEKIKEKEDKNFVKKYIKMLEQNLKVKMKLK